MRLLDKIKNQPPLWWFYQQFVVFIAVVMFATAQKCAAGWTAFALVWTYNGIVTMLVRFCGIYIGQKITILFNLLISTLMGIGYYETESPVYIAGIVITVIPAFPNIYDFLAVIMKWPTTRRLLKCRLRQSTPVKRFIAHPSAPKLDSPEIHNPRPSAPKLDSPTIYNPRPSAPKLDSPEIHNPRPSAPKLDSPEIHNPRPSAPKLDSPTIHNPRPSSIDIHEFTGTQATINLANLNTKTVAMADECSICLEPMGDVEKCGVLNCAHSFHTWCIEEWLAIGQSCPLCRSVV